LLAWCWSRFVSHGSQDARHGKEIAQLDQQGIVHGIRSKQDLEECTSAYKDIYQVLKDEEDLVKPIVRLQPIAVLKG
jgi:tRNA-splicing ligase RtcB